ncbi:MAG: DUF308 domain-containing protein [Alphaproteobacteria bacterium]|nr:DUF308 domain-containing protein [Alphaproteobacteria bacterium]
MKEASELFDEKPSKRAWLLIVSLLTIALGIYVLFNPVEALLGLAIYIGLAFVLIGFGYLMLFQEFKNYLYLTISLLDIVVGMLLLINIGLTTVTLPLIIALWMLFGGISQLVEAWRMKDNMISYWMWFLFSGVISIIFAIFVVFHPIISMVAVTTFIGLYFIIYGIFELVRYLRQI